MNKVMFKKESNSGIELRMKIQSNNAVSNICHPDSTPVLPLHTDGVKNNKNDGCAGRWSNDEYILKQMEERIQFLNFKINEELKEEFEELEECRRNNDASIMIVQDDNVVGRWFQKSNNHVFTGDESTSSVEAKANLTTFNIKDRFVGKMEKTDKEVNLNDEESELGGIQENLNNTQAALSDVVSKLRTVHRKQDNIKDVLNNEAPKLESRHVKSSFDIATSVYNSFLKRESVPRERSSYEEPRLYESEPHLSHICEQNRHNCTSYGGARSTTHSYIVRGEKYVVSHDALEDECDNMNLNDDDLEGSASRHDDTPLSSLPDLCSSYYDFDEDFYGSEDDEPYQFSFGKCGRVEVLPTITEVSSRCSSSLTASPVHGQMLRSTSVHVPCNFNQSWACTMKVDITKVCIGRSESTPSNFKFETYSKSAGIFHRSKAQSITPKLKLPDFSGSRRTMADRDLFYELPAKTRSAYNLPRLNIGKNPKYTSPTSTRSKDQNTKPRRGSFGTSTKFLPPIYQSPLAGVQIISSKSGNIIESGDVNAECTTSNTTEIHNKLRPRRLGGTFTDTGNNRNMKVAKMKPVDKDTPYLRGSKVNPLPPVNHLTNKKQSTKKTNRSKIKRLKSTRKKPTVA